MWFLLPIYAPPTPVVSKLFLARPNLSLCHLQPISVVLNRAMRSLNTDKLLTNKVTTIYKMQKILQLKDIYNLEVSKFMYKYTNSQLPATFNNYF